MRGLRKVQKAKAPKPRPGLDDPAHKARIRAMRCVLAGKRCQVTRWKGVYPNRVQVTEEYVHSCVGPIDPHHTVKKSQRGHDHTCVPMCRAAHEQAELLTNEGFRQKWGVALPMIASQLAGVTHKGGAA